MRQTYLGKVRNPSLPDGMCSLSSVGTGGASQVAYANAGDTRDVGLTPGWGRAPGEGNGNPFQYSCMENSLDRGAWWATVHGVKKSQTRVSMHACTHVHIEGFTYSLQM